MGKDKNLVEQKPDMLRDVKSKIIVIREQNVIVDADVACLYGVETKRINEAVRNNPEKFPETYMFQLNSTETEILRSKFSTANFSTKSRALPKAFAEKGLYMLATILKSKMAVNTTFAIIETFAMVRTLKQELVELHKEPDKNKQVSIMKDFGNVLSEVVMPDLETTETESSLEINFFIGKLKHSVKRVKKV